MRDYRLYIIGAGGAIKAVEELVAPGDDEAIVASSSKHIGHGRELWCGPRMVASWDIPAKARGAPRPDFASSISQRFLRQDRPAIGRNWRN